MLESDKAGKDPKLQYAGTAGTPEYGAGFPCKRFHLVSWRRLDLTYSIAHERRPRTIRSSRKYNEKQTAAYKFDRCHPQGASKHEAKAEFLGI